MRREYSPTELWMGYGVVAGGLVGTLLLVFTGSPLWLAAVPVGIVIGLIVGQFRENGSRS